jgi:hypothetical protein
VLPRVNDPEVIQGEIFQGDSHRSGDIRRFVEFGFHRIATSSVEEKKVYFRAIMRCPEKRFRWFDDPQDLL